MSAGEMLQSERRRRNRSLADIAAQTCISSRYLDAIERDDVKELPGEFFYKAFLRQYAKSLELDGATTDRILASAVPMSEPDPVPVLSGVYARASQTNSSRWTPSTAVAAGALVFVLAVGSGLYAWWQRRANQIEMMPAEQTAPTTASAPLNTNPPAQKQQTTAPTPQTPDPQPQTTPAQPSETKPQAASAATTLELSASEPTWVQLTSGGKTIYIGTLQPSDPKQFAVTEAAKLLTGNAGALDVKMNGRSVGSLGPKGQVRTVVFSNNSFEVSPPRPRPSDTGDAAQTRPAATAVALRPATADH